MLKDKTILVLGGAGFIGRNTVQELIKQECRVRVFDVYKIDDFDNCKNVESMIGDITNVDDLERAFDGVDIVFHFAGFADMEKSSKNAQRVLELNILGTNMILEKCVEHKVEKLVFASSMYVFSDLGSFYKVSKLTCEMLIEEYNKEFGLNFVILRYGSLYGPGATHGNAIYELISQALSENKISYWGTGEELRQYIHVSDAAVGAIRSLDSSFNNSYLSLTGLEDVKTSDLINMIQEILGNDVEVQFSANPGGKYHYKRTPFTFRPKTGRKLVFDSYKDLGQGILDCINDLHCEHEL